TTGEAAPGRVLRRGAGRAPVPRRDRDRLIVHGSQHTGSGAHPDRRRADRVRPQPRSRRPARCGPRSDRVLGGAPRLPAGPNGRPMSALGHLAAGGPTAEPTPLRRRKSLPYLLLLPGLLWLAFFFVIPAVQLFATSLYDPSGSLEAGYAMTWQFSNYSA